MKTAVDYLEERMECGGITWEDIQQAKELEKRQIEQAFDSGHLATWNETPEQYYNKTFKP
jgi:hypothetical protein